MIDALAIGLFQLILELGKLSVHLRFKQQALTFCLTLCLSEAFEGMEILLIVFSDDLTNQGLFNSRSRLLTLIDKDNERHQEVNLLLEILLIFLLSDLEGIHGDGFLLGIGDIGSIKIS